MSYQPDFMPKDWSDIGSALTAVQSQRIKEATDAAHQLLQLEATSKKRREIEKEILFVVSKSVEEIPQTLKTNPAAGIIEIDEMMETLRSGNIDSSSFDTLEFKELAHRVWKKLDELEKLCIANYPDFVMAYEKLKKQRTKDEKETEQKSAEPSVQQNNIFTGLPFAFAVAIVVAVVFLVIALALSD